MFKNKRMFSSGSNATLPITSRINIKAVLLMLVMMFVGFGVFGGSVFAAEYPEGRAVFKDGHSVQLAFKKASGSFPGPSEAYVHTDTLIKKIKRANTIDPSNQTQEHLISDSSSDIPIYFWFEEDGGTAQKQVYNRDTREYEDAIGNTGIIYWYTTDPNPIINENASSMFEDFKSASEIDTSDLDPSFVKDIQYCFSYCESLTNVDVKNWVTSSYTPQLSGVFRGCKSITEIDLSTWDTTNAYNITGLFDGMTSLKTIYVSEKFSAGENPIYVFSNDTNLVGGKGTKFDSSITDGNDGKYAHIDGGPSNPGYFTNIADKPVSSPDENASTGTGTDNADGTVTVQIPITKLMHMNAADATILNDYTFTMTPAEAVHTQSSYTGGTSPAQTDNTVTIHKEAFNRITELNSNNNKVVISNVNNNGASGVDNDVFTLTFTNGQIGQFHYHVVETPITSGLQSGVTQDSTLYDIVVTIENKDPSNITNGEVKFAGVTMSTSTDNGTTWTKTNTGESTKSDRGGAGVDINNAKFTNTFHTADVLVDKTVRGSLGDKTKDFTFTFNVQGTNIPTTYKLYKTNAANETAEPVDVQNGSTFTLKHNESAKVMGLPEGASYRITETGTADYTTKIDANLGDPGSDNGFGYTLVNGTVVANNGDMYPEVAAQTGGESISISKFDNENSDVSITAASNLDEQHFTNMKGQLIPTGLIENMASFLGLALIAVFAIGYMLYKRKKDTVSEEA